MYVIEQVCTYTSKSSLSRFAVRTSDTNRATERVDISVENDVHDVFPTSCLER